MTIDDILLLNRNRCHYPLISYLNLNFEGGRKAVLQTWIFFWIAIQKIYRKVANSSLSWLVARFQIFRRLVKGKFDAYVL